MARPLWYALPTPVPADWKIEPLLWHGLPTVSTATTEGLLFLYDSEAQFLQVGLVKVDPGCNVRQAQAGAVLPSADVKRGIDARRAAPIGVTGAGPRFPITSRPCRPAVPRSVVLWHSHDCRISPPVCRG